MPATADPAAVQSPAPMTSAPDPPPTAAVADALPAPHAGLLRGGWAKFRDNAIPTLVVAVIGSLAVFSFTDTKDRIDRLEDSVNARFSELKGEIATDFAAVDARFAAVDARFTKLEDDIDTRFTKLEDDIDTRFTKLEDDIDTRFTKLEDDIDTRFTKLESDIDTRFAAVDARFVRLEAEIDARFTKLEENQHEIAVTLTRLVALLEAGNEAEGAAPG